MNTIIRRFWVLFGMALAVLLPLIVCTWPAAADPYGQGGYSICTYQISCPPPTTQTTLPSGLKISVNLSDGQAIPRSGYKITITPINGQGNSFKQAAIYIDGVLAGTAVPDDTGTASWFWDPVATPGTVVAVTITDADGTDTTQTFHVTITGAAPLPNPIPGSTTRPPKPKRGGIAALLDIAGDGLGKLSQSAVRTIKSLPVPLAYGFPYILFGLLGLNALLLLYQMHREVREYHVLRSLLAREKMIAESKKTFMELVSHYLRTPITIVMGGIDMLPKNGPSPNATIAATLQAVARAMGTKIEGLITDTRTASEIALAQRGDTALSATALWRQPGLFVPVLLILAILVPYNYLAQHGGGLNISQINIAAQTITFLALVTASYLVLRQLRLHRRDQHELRRLSDAQATSDHIRDELITSTATTLRADITTIDGLAGQLGTSQATKFISDGQRRFHDVLTKCTIAASLRGSHSDSSKVTTTLGGLLDAAQKSLSDAHGCIVRVAAPTNAIATKNPELVSYVLHTVLHNAYTYSTPGTNIDIATHATKDGTSIVITDHGEGMPSDKVALLFQPFFKVEGAEKFNHEGMGFSLYLDKLIMEYLGGTITLVSQKGHGTTVTLHLPA